MRSANWTDADILAYLDTANRAEINAGKLAERKATSPAVKSFARRMVSDHTKLLTAGQSLAKKLNVDVSSATNNDVTDMAKNSADAMNDLTSKQAGHDWDEDYVDKQIDAHKTVIDHVNDFISATQNAQLKSALQQALPKLQAHQKAAQTLKDSTLSA
jgi:putative membrane protein